MNVRKISAAAVLALWLTLSALTGQAQNGPPPVPWPKPYLVVEAWADRPYVSDLSVYGLNGRRLARLTQEPLPSCYNPVLSPDGSELVFTANAMNLYVLSLRYNLINALYVGTPGAAVFSADGSRLAFVGRTSEADPRASLYVSPLYEEMKKTPVAPIPLDADPNDVQDLTFSPDRSQILYVQWKGDHADLRVCDLATRSCSALLSQPDISFYEPTFSPDGKTLLFVREDHEVWSLMSLRWPDKAPTLIKTFPRGRDLLTPAYTRDGKHIVFELDGSLGWMQADGGNVEGLSEPLPTTDDPFRGIVDRFRPVRSPGVYFDVAQNYVVYTEWKDQKSAVMMIDLRTKAICKVPAKVKHYLLCDLAATPDVLDALLQNAPAAVYDRRPDPERFTLREVLAHLADWEDVFRGRLIQTRDEENATLIGLDEGQVALDHDYAHADPAESLARFRQGRGKLLALLHSLTPAQGNRTAQHTEIGPITLGEQVVLIAGHDGYHLQQVAQWLSP